MNDRVVLACNAHGVEPKHWHAAAVLFRMGSIVNHSLVLLGPGAETGESCRFSPRVACGCPQLDRGPQQPWILCARDCGAVATGR